MSRIVVTIVVYRSDPVVVARALVALAASDHPVDEVLLHVNADDGSWTLPPTPGPPLTVSRSPANLGFAGAHNRLLRTAFASGADLAIVHNPDVTLDGGAVGALLRAARSEVRLLGPVLEQADPVDGRATGLVDTLGIRWTMDGRHLDTAQSLPMPVLANAPWRVQGISGACLAVPRRAYERITGPDGEFFDEDFIAYREDAELALRADVLGIESWIVPNAKGLHVRHQRGTARGADAFVDLLGVRNRFLIAAKWGRRRPGFLPTAILRDLTVVVAVLVRERSSLPGLRQAVGLIPRMIRKRRRIMAWSQAHPEIAP